MPVDYQKGINKDPVVSIICDSYNHEPYIRRCIEGFLMQKTDFPFEILIHDDASTDKSAEIIKEYEVKFPALIKPMYQRENQCSKGVHLWASIQFPRVNGKYIAICEGDDYWTDPLKLQKQVDYMEAHPDCSLSFHNAMVHWYDGSNPDRLFWNIEERDYSGRELVKNWIAPTASFLFRGNLWQGFADFQKEYPSIYACDFLLLVHCARNGVVHGFDDVMSVYGKHGGSWSDFSDAARTYSVARMWEERKEAFGPEYADITTDTMTGYYLNAFFRGLRQSQWGIAAKAFYRGVLRQPVTGIRALARIPQERRHRQKEKENE